MASSFITAEHLTIEIGRGRYRPVYYFFGEEDFRKSEAVKYILNHYVPEQQRVFNFSRLSIEKIDFETVCSELAAIPMLGERRLILINEAQKLKPTQQKRLFSLLGNPSPETIIILSSPAARTPRKNSAFFKAVGRVAQPVQFGRLTRNMATIRIHKRLESAGFTYDKEAIDLLISLTDGDFGGLDGELEKLTLSSEKGSHIGLGDVRRMASSYQDFNIFELIDLIAEKKADRALEAYHDLIRKGMRPASLLRQLSNHILNLLRVHTGKQVSGAPYFVNKLRHQAPLFDKEKVLDAISRIAATEREIRRSAIKPPILVENLIREISR